MIFKSYLLEINIQQILKLNMFLFYGENEGLKNEFRNSLKIKNKIIFSQEDLIKNEELLLNEIYNKSLFEDQKIIIIDNADDKIIKLIEPLENLNDVKIFIFAQTLSKKSKIRNLFEKSKNYGICACYDDSEVTLKKITFEKLKNIKGINPAIVNYIIQQCGLNRYKLNNEIEKIKTYFHDKEILYEKLEELLNVRTNSDFNKLKDEALNGNKINTNRLIADTVIEEDKIHYYLSVINQRIQALNYISDNEGHQNLEKNILDLKPPIFWKDKPNFIYQAKKWNKKKIKKLLETTYKLELQIKSNSSINKTILMKKLIIDMCGLANS